MCSWGVTLTATATATAGHGGTTVDQLEPRRPRGLGSCSSPRGDMTRTSILLIRCLLAAFAVLHSPYAAAAGRSPVKKPSHNHHRHPTFALDLKPCKPGCELHGNCNGETGLCDCPFGYTGDTCTERILPACHSSTANGTLPHYGTLYPKNCHCYRQLAVHGCTALLQKHADPLKVAASQTSACLYQTFDRGALLCYEYKDVPAAEQLSDSPPIGDARITWNYASRFWPETVINPIMERDDLPTEVVMDEHRAFVWAPQDDCTNRCSEQGWCVRAVSDGTTSCRCHGYYEGDACEKSVTARCYRNCSGVGTCVAGWCHCEAGYWGHGCTRTKAYTSAKGWRPNHASLKIYVYDLPTHVVHKAAFNDEWQLIDEIYNAEWEFTQWLLADWSVRTENPWEANLFYVPAFTYWYTGNLGNPATIFLHVTDWLKQNSPFWALTGGRNHLLWATNDRGACDLYGHPLEVQRPIKLVHFGQAPRIPYARGPHGGHTNIFRGMWNTITGCREVDGPSVVQAVHKEDDLTTPHHMDEFPAFWGGDVKAESIPCYRPEKDVVAPPAMRTEWANMSYSWYEQVWDVQRAGRDPAGPAVITYRAGAPKRNITFFFAGSTRSEASYSQGVRQALLKLFGRHGKHDPKGRNARHDFVVATKVQDAAAMMRISKFCLAPSGFGWGIRLSEALLSGCIPVLVQDHTYQALWDALPYEEFSLRVPRNRLPSLVDILDDIGADRLKQLQAGVERWHRAFLWDPSAGLAYKYTLTSLYHRLLSLWSVNYRRVA